MGEKGERRSKWEKMLDNNRLVINWTMHATHSEHPSKLPSLELPAKDREVGPLHSSGNMQGTRTAALNVEAGHHSRSQTSVEVKDNPRSEGAHSTPTSQGHKRTLPEGASPTPYIQPSGECDFIIEIKEGSQIVPASKSVQVTYNHNHWTQEEHEGYLKGMLDNRNV